MKITNEDFLRRLSEKTRILNHWKNIGGVRPIFYAVAKSAVTSGSFGQAISLRVKGVLPALSKGVRIIEGKLNRFLPQNLQSRIQWLMLWDSTKMRIQKFCFDVKAVNTSGMQNRVIY